MKVWMSAWIPGIFAISACGSPATHQDAAGDDAAPADASIDAVCESSCSADLRNVVDCHGNVADACAADRVCSAGACVDPCAAAAEAKSSVGCDYYAVAPDIISDGAGGCYAAFVANTWSTPVTITVEYQGSTLPVTGFGRIPSGAGQGLTYAPLTNDTLQPGEVAILFLSRDAAGVLPADCPAGITPAITTDTAVRGTALGHAFHIRTSAPTAAYDIYPYGGGNSAATSATLLLPTSAWDTDYIAADAFAASQSSPGQPFVQIVAQQDATTVTIRPVVDIVGGTGVPASPAQTPVTYTLNAGEVLQFTQAAELAGSPVSADKPIGLWGGASCLNIPTNGFACDGAHQQIPNTKALGYRYAGVRYRDRFAGVEETVPWRVVGAVDGTTLTYSPAPPPGAPTTLSLGQVVTFSTSQPFTVTSQDGDHPFYMAGYMTGCGALNDGSDCRGDPEYVNVIPLDQYLPSYTFFTDPTYPETSLVLTRERTNGAFSDVTLDCLGTVTGWTAIDAADTIELARVDLVTGNFESVNGCNNGRHLASSGAPFGLVVWGWGSAATGGIFGFPSGGGFYSQAVSYAYPAGASVKPINTVVIF